jgi:hypothetical protein
MDVEEESIVGYLSAFYLPQPQEFDMNRECRRERVNTLDPSANMQCKTFFPLPDLKVNL